MRVPEGIKPPVIASEGCVYAHGIWSYGMEEMFAPIHSERVDWPMRKLKQSNDQWCKFITQSVSHTFIGLASFAAVVSRATSHF